MKELLYFYLGGVIALLCESLVQWLHPEESTWDEDFVDALFTSALWPIMAVFAILETILGMKR